MCHTLKCRGNTLTLINMMSRKVPNQSFEVFIFAVGGSWKRAGETNKKNRTETVGGRRRLRCYAERMDCTKLGETLRHKGVNPGASFLISKSTGLWDLLVKGVSVEMPTVKCLVSSSYRLSQRERCYVLPVAWPSPPSEVLVVVLLAAALAGSSSSLSSSLDCGTSGSGTVTGGTSGSCSALLFKARIRW